MAKNHYSFEKRQKEVAKKKKKEEKRLRKQERKNTNVEKTFDNSDDGNETSDYQQS